MEDILSGTQSRSPGNLTPILADSDESSNGSKFVCSPWDKSSSRKIASKMVSSPDSGDGYSEVRSNSSSSTSFALAGIEVGVPKANSEVDGDCDMFVDNGESGDVWSSGLGTEKLTVPGDPNSSAKTTAGAELMEKGLWVCISENSET